MSSFGEFQFDGRRSPGTLDITTSTSSLEQSPSLHQEEEREVDNERESESEEEGHRPRARRAPTPSRHPTSPSILSAVPSQREAGNGIPCTRVLSYKQLRDMIQEIYISKAKRDQKCIASSLPRETMEEHFFTFLNHRFGLRPLILEWATATFNAIGKFSQVDCDIWVFGKILKGELPESFVAEQQQLRFTLVEVLRAYLRSKHPLQTGTGITAMLRRRVDGNIPDDEWMNMVKSIYTPGDSHAIIQAARAELREAEVLADELNTESGGGTGSHKVHESRGRDAGHERTGDSCMPFGIILQVLLRHQAEQKVAQLQEFVQLFQQCDMEGRGSLSPPEFRALYLELNPATSDKMIAESFRQADPLGRQRLTFSECVDHFVKASPSHSRSHSWEFGGGGDKLERGHKSG